MNDQRAVSIRPYEPADAPALLALFRNAIRRVNSRDYNPEQIAAWASDDIDPIAWAGRFTHRYAIVAEIDGKLAGFTELELDGHIDRFYVSADHQRLGVGKEMLDAIVIEARRTGASRLYTEASITARPFFASQGFNVIAPQTVVVRDVEFVNFRMERRLR
jgi:putative acetyltransferase